MSRAGNGLTISENLAHQRSQRIFKEEAEVPLTRCTAHPTKRMWESDTDAIREAEVRSEVARMPIVAYRCDACGNAHLCKAENARVGTILERQAPERNWEVFTLKGGNSDARLKILAAYLEGKETVTTAELVEAMEWHRKTVSDHMHTLGWAANRGPGARWFPTNVKARANVTPIVQPEAPIELAKRRHPSAQDAGWRPMTEAAKLHHLPLGDIVETLKAVGLELRLQIKEIS
jgi:hypothetical protein